MIYFIKCNEFVKIGYSKTRGGVKLRLISMQVGNPYELVLLKIINGMVETEKKLHKKFSKYHTRGEWFEYIGELKSFIDSVKFDYFVKCGGSCKNNMPNYSSEIRAINRIKTVLGYRARIVGITVDEIISDFGIDIFNVSDEELFGIDRLLYKISKNMGD